MSTKIAPKEYAHRISVRDFEQRFQVDITKGLSSERAKELLQKNGQNQIQVSYGNVAKAVLIALTDKFSLQLWVCLVLFVLLYHPLGYPDFDPKNLINMALILLCFLVKSILVGVQEIKMMRLMRSLHYSMSTMLVSVLRDSQWQMTAAANLVVGDVIKLKTGQRVPADMRIIHVQNLRFDKSIISGESEPVEASEKALENINSNIAYFEARNMAFTNFLVVSGQGQGVVVATGNRTHMSVWTKPTSRRNPKRYDPISRSLDQVAYTMIALSMLSLIVYIIVWAVWIRPNFNIPTSTIVWNLLNIIVTGFPVGLPVALIAGLFAIQQRFGRAQMVVKDTLAIGSMGGIDVVLTDKTGTLTCNSLQVDGILYSTKEIDVEMCNLSSDVYLGAQSTLNELLELCDFCHVGDECGNDSAIRDENVVETKLFEFAQKNMKKIVRDKFDVVDEIKFNSANKYHVKLLECRHGNSTDAHELNSEFMLIIRGAPDVLIPKCQYILNADGGGYVPMDEESKRLIEAKMNEWSLKSRRLICFCKKLYSQASLDSSSSFRDVREKMGFESWFKSQSCDFIFIGMIGFIDPPRPNINESVNKLGKMGVRVVMVTGDYALTAASIAHQVGILTDMKYDTFARFRDANNPIKNPSAHSKPAILLSGSEIDRLTSDDWTTICKKYSEIILSRATPSHKLRCVKEFQSNGHSVLMVGDGVNDVPALKRADLSVAMGAGSKMASDLSSVILLDNSFGSICDLIMVGRQVFVNIRKVFLYVMISSVFSQYSTTLLTSTLGIPQLYSNLQMTIVAAFTDVLPSFSLFFEKPEPDELKSSQKNLSLISLRLIVMAFVVIGPMTLTLAYMNYLVYFRFFSSTTNISDLLYGYTDHSLSEQELTAQTIGFYSIVVIHTFGNLYSIRTNKLSILKRIPCFKGKRNWRLVGWSILVCSLLTILVSLSLDAVTVQLPPIFYALIWGCSIFMLSFNELIKLADVCIFSRRKSSIN